MAHPAEAAGRPTSNGENRPESDEEGPAAVFGDESGETQEVSQTHGASRHGHDDAQP